jgi:hypothetical protein
MSECSDGLHFNGVPLLQRMVQDTGRIHHLTKHSDRGVTPGPTPAFITSDPYLDSRQCFFYN